MNLQQKQTKEKHLIFESHVNKSIITKKSSLHSASIIWFWSDRLALIDKKDDDEYWTFTAFDLLMNESTPIRFRKTRNGNSRYTEVYPLNDEFGLIIEYFSGFHYFNLVKLNWDMDEFQIVQKFEHEVKQILFDNFEPSKFVLKSGNFRAYNYRVFKLVEEKIEFGEIVESEYSVDFYSNDKFISAYPSGVTTYDLNLKQEHKVIFNKLLMLKNIKFLYDPYECVNDRFYTLIKYEDTENYGLAWADLKTKKWELLDIQTTLPIFKIQYLNENLIVEAKNDGQNKEIIERKIYSVPMRRPNSLRQSAWLLVVKVMKIRAEKDPYTAAEEFLPLTSDLREIWSRNEKQKELKESLKAMKFSQT